MDYAGRNIFRSTNTWISISLAKSRLRKHSQLVFISTIDVFITISRIMLSHRQPIMLRCIDPVAHRYHPVYSIRKITVGILEQIYDSSGKCHHPHQHNNNHLYSSLSKSLHRYFVHYRMWILRYVSKNLIFYCLAHPVSEKRSLPKHWLAFWMCQLHYVIAPP